MTETRITNDHGDERDPESGRIGEGLNDNVSKVFRSLGVGRWSHIEPEPYKKDSEHYRGVVRRELIGKRGESTGFHMRYFEVDPNGYTTLERHQHAHAVIVTRGRGQVTIGCKDIIVSVGDVIYVGPDDPHQFTNPFPSESFGFVCVVDANRDRPRAVEGGQACIICE